MAHGPVCRGRLEACELEVFDSWSPEKRDLFRQISEMRKSQSEKPKEEEAVHDADSRRLEMQTEAAFRDLECSVGVARTFSEHHEERRLRSCPLVHFLATLSTGLLHSKKSFACVGLCRRVTVPKLREKYNSKSSRTHSHTSTPESASFARETAKTGTRPSLRNRVGDGEVAVIAICQPFSFGCDCAS